jgi:hypothetical protein
MRLIGFKRRATIAFRVAPGIVSIVRVLHRGRAFDSLDVDDLATGSDESR